MKQVCHKIKTWMPYFQEVLDGKRPVEFRLNDRNYQVGDGLHHIEWNPAEEKETGRQCWAKIVSIMKGGVFGIPDGYVIITQHTSAVEDFQRDFVNMDKVLKEFEGKLTSKYGCDISERLNHVLGQFNRAATEAAWKGKNFLEDVKTQFQAVIIALEGVTSESYNHGQKRVIANHVINILRSNIDRIDRVKWDYQNSMYENFNYFRSESPEGDLLKRYRDLKAQFDRLKQNIAEANNKLPDDQKIPDELPF